MFTTNLATTAGHVWHHLLLLCDRRLALPIAARTPFTIRTFLTCAFCAGINCRM
jgi:hypothetical protein